MGTSDTTAVPDTGHIAGRTARVHRVGTRPRPRWWERAFLHPWPTTPSFGSKPVSIPRTA